MRISMIALMFVIVLCNSSSASVTMITNKQQWLTLVGHHEFIGFTGYANNTLITTQYQHQGVVFADGDDFIHISGSYPSDGAGLASAAPFGQHGSIQVSFDGPRYALAFDFIGLLEVAIYNQTQQIYNSGWLIADETPFVGFISTEPFDSAIGRDFNGTVVSIDNLYFGPPVPAPGVLATLAFAMMTRARRRR